MKRTVERVTHENWFKGTRACNQIYSKGIFMSSLNGIVLKIQFKRIIMDTHCKLRHRMSENSREFQLPRLICMQRGQTYLSFSGFKLSTIYNFFSF